jgi:hypothetical protein
MSPAVTHILVEPLTQPEYLKYCVYGVLTYVLRIEWLIDSIYFSRKVFERDYEVRSFKKSNSSTEETDERSNVSSIQSSQLISLKQNYDSNKKSISMPIKHANLYFPVKRKHKSVSVIFAGKNFYIESSHRKYI